MTTIFNRRLDEVLAAGAHAQTDTLLGCRAQQLLARAKRRRLAEALRDAVEHATLARAPGSAVPVAGASVRADSGLLLALANRLDSDRPVSACGVARTQLLLTDGGSPLYTGTPLGLERALESALIGLAG